MQSSLNDRFSVGGAANLDVRLIKLKEYMRHIFPKFEVGGNAELTSYCITARRLLRCDNFTSGKGLSKEDQEALVAPLSEEEMSFKAVEPSGIKEALKQIYSLTNGEADA